MKLYLANKADLEPNNINCICLQPASLTRKSMAILLPTLLALMVFIIKIFQRISNLDSKKRNIPIFYNPELDFTHKDMISIQLKL